MLRRHNVDVRRTVVGSALGILLSVAAGAALVPVRNHLSVAIAGLVLIVPVVAGVTVGGWLAGLVSVAAGFLVYDFSFIPPYYTLTVRAGQNWVALAVYTVVMILVARVVSSFHEASEASEARTANARRLVELSELLLGDRSVPDLARTVVEAVNGSFGVRGAALLLSDEGGLRVAAAAGDVLPDAELARLRSDAGVPVALSSDRSGETVRTLALAASGRPVGLLVLIGVSPDPATKEILPALGNHVALALERSQMREQLRRAELLEEVDRLRHALVEAVSHDLRTPLASIKVASSTLVNPSASLSPSDTDELHQLIDEQTDRLTRIVNDILDMTRIQAGVLEPHREACSTLDLVVAAVAASKPALHDRRVEVRVPPGLPMVDVDHLLVEQVLYNLLENADRHAPPGTAITIEAAVRGHGYVAVSVSDRGPGVPPPEREAVFDTFVRFDTGGRAGLGLAISKAFVESHGGRIWVEAGEGSGARFVFTLPQAEPVGARA